MGQDLEKRLQVGFPACCCAVCFLGWGAGGWGGEVTASHNRITFSQKWFQISAQEIRWDLQTPLFLGGLDTLVTLYLRTKELLKNLARLGSTGQSRIWV